jgi:hypothetical protein
MLRRVALVKTDVSEERSASIIRVTRIGELGTSLAVTSNRRTLRRNTMRYSSIVFPRCVPRLLATANIVPRYRFPEDGIIHMLICHKSGIILISHKYKRILNSHNCKFVLISRSRTEHEISDNFE